MMDARGDRDTSEVATRVLRTGGLAALWLVSVFRLVLGLSAGVIGIAGVQVGNPFIHTNANGMKTNLGCRDKDGDRRRGSRHPMEKGRALPVSQISHEVAGLAGDLI